MMKISKRESELLAMIDNSGFEPSIFGLSDAIIKEMAKLGMVEDSDYEAPQNWSLTRYGYDLACGRLDVEVVGE